MDLFVREDLIVKGVSIPTMRCDCTVRLVTFPFLYSVVLEYIVLGVVGGAERIGVFWGTVTATRFWGVGVGLTTVGGSVIRLGAVAIAEVTVRALLGVGQMSSLDFNSSLFSSRSLHSILANLDLMEDICTTAKNPRACNKITITKAVLKLIAFIFILQKFQGLSWNNFVWIL